uniref:Uncharacterized protein n=1 Tax=Globodera rostochiensis TaxID=31243 RepID=A0A914HFA2_GLORO
MTIGFLAFCSVLIGTVFADLNCFNALENSEFHGPDNNVLAKLYMNSELSNGNGEDEELKQFVCDLSEHEIVIGAALNDHAQGQPISHSLKEKFEFLKKIELIDKPVAELLHKLHKSINAVKNSINRGVQNATFKDLKGDLYGTVIFLANRWQIPLIEIVSMENEKIDDKSLLLELGKLWAKYKGQNWQNDHESYEKRKNGQREKRMLRLMMDFSIDGSDGLGNLKSVKKSQRRRRKRGSGGIAIIFVVVLCALLVLAIWQCNSGRQKNHRDDLEAGIFERDEVVEQLEPLPRERTKYERRQQQMTHKKVRREKSSHPKMERQGSESKQPLNQLSHSSSQGDPSRGKSPPHLDVLNGGIHSTSDMEKKTKTRRAKSSHPKMERQGSESKQPLNQLSPSSSKGDPSREKSPPHLDVSNGGIHSSSDTEKITRTRRAKSSHPKMERQGSESKQPLNQLSPSSSKGDPSRGKSPPHLDVLNGGIHSTSDMEKKTKTRRAKSSHPKRERQDQLSPSSSKGDPSRGKSPPHPDPSNGSAHSLSDTEKKLIKKRAQESKKGSHPESIEKGTEKAGPQLAIQNITIDQLRKINVVSGDITKQKVSIIVTDANSRLSRVGGISDAIHRACEPEMDMLQLVLNTLRESKGSAYPPGSVVVTDAFGNLRKKNVQFIAHAVGPIVQDKNPSAEHTLALKLCYTGSLDHLIAKKGQTIAFPNISTGNNGFPKDLAAVAALEAILNWLNTGANKHQVQQITLVCLSRNDEQLYKDLIEAAKRQIVPSRQSIPRTSAIGEPSTQSTPRTSAIGEPSTQSTPRTSAISEPSTQSTPRTSAINEPSTSQSPSPAPLPLAVNDKPTPIVEEAIRQSVRCVNVKGDGDCFYRAICYGLFRVDSMENSDALRKASGRILRAILENPNFFPRKRYRSHADFTHELSQLLLPSPSDLWYNQTLEAYSRHIENPARGSGIWAQLDDAHTIAILLQRPVVILRPIAEDDILRDKMPKWNNKSITQRIDVRFPDGEYMGMTRNIPHVQLNNFTVQQQTPQDVVVERTVVNPIVIWYDGIEHYQSIVFDPKSPNASAGSEYIFAQNFDIPEDFLYGNKAPHQQQQHPPEQQSPQGVETGTMSVDTFESLPTETVCRSPAVSKNSRHNQLRKINVVKGDITKQKVSIIVTDANSRLSRVGGISDAIHRACEPEMDMLQLELNTLRESKESAYPPGSVVVTDAFGVLRKNVQFIAHAVGPIVQGINPSAEDTLALKLCYTGSLDALIAKNGQTIAFPNISTGNNGFPKDLAAVAALEAILNWLNTSPNEHQVQQITLVCLRQSDKQLYEDLIESELYSAPTPIAEQAIRQTVNCVNVKGDGDCFYRAICYGLFRVDSMENSDALRKASGRILRAILENPNFFPRKRYRSHADFTHELSQLLLPSPSDHWYNQTLEAYSRHIENPARGSGIWAQLDDAHTIAILLQRPVVILRPIAEDDILRDKMPKWNNKSITQRIDVRFPDGEYMGMTRNIPHVQLNNFTVQERTPEDAVVERTVVNPIVIWYDGIEHYQSIVFDPNSPNASAGSEYIFAQNFDIPEDFLHGNKAPHQQQQHPPEHQSQGVETGTMSVDTFGSLPTETACRSPAVSSEPSKKTLA